jgi:hypothetical protein
MIESWMIGSSKYPQSKHVHTNALKLAPEEDIEEVKSRHSRDEEALKTAEGKVKDTYSPRCPSVQP